MVGIIIVLVVLLLLSGLFSATETAFSTVNIFRIKQLAKSGKKGNKKAKIVYDLHNRFSSLLSTILEQTSSLKISPIIFGSVSDKMT